MHLYAGEAQLKLVARISRLEERHRALLGSLPDAMRRHFHARHRQASAVQGALSFAWGAVDRPFRVEVMFLPPTAKLLAAGNATIT